jgi:protein-tyrosine-phosphatase
MTNRPAVLFACVHNSGRSVAAAALARHYAGELVDVRDAGSEPSGTVNPTVARVLAELGLPVVDHTPTRLDYDLVEQADVVITLGCNEACPAVPGKRVVDWAVADPKGQPENAVRQIVADLDERVRALLLELAPELRLPAALTSAFRSGQVSPRAQ